MDFIHLIRGQRLAVLGDAVEVLERNRTEVMRVLVEMTAVRRQVFFAVTVGDEHLLAGLLIQDIFAGVRVAGVAEDVGHPSTIDKLLKKEHAAFTKGEQIWDFLYCDDAAEAFYLIGEKTEESKIYPLGSGERRTLSEYITALGRVVDPAAALGIGELPYPPGQAMFLQADISELQKDTGFAPVVGFEKGVRLTAEWRKQCLEQDN